MIRSLALIGANGMLAQAVRNLAGSAQEVFPLDLPEFDITDRERVLSELVSLRPEVIVNCAAYTNVDGCESSEELATSVNGAGPGYLAEAARMTGATLVHISTDYVFSGNKTIPYAEEDETSPLSAYGRSKLAGEQAILRSGLERFFILRTSWLYGPGGKNFVQTIIRLSREREELSIVADQVGTPTYTGDLAQAILNLLQVETAESASPAPFGIYHFSNEGVCSWYEFSTEIVSQLRLRGEDLKVRQVRPIRTEEYPLPATRPKYSVFSKDKYKNITGAQIPHWRESLREYLGMAMK